MLFEGKAYMKRQILIAAGVVMFCAFCAQAELIYIAIEADVDSIDDPCNIFEGNISVGDTITGYYAYESTTPDTNPLEYYGTYSQSNAGCEIVLMLNTFEFKTDPNNLDWRIGIANNYPESDGYSVRSSSNLPLSDGTIVNDIYWQLKDSTETALTNTDLPTSAPVLNDWDYNHLRISTDRAFSIDSHVASAELVPEPFTLLLMSLGALALRKRNQ
jgi:hypothetical protein